MSFNAYFPSGGGYNQPVGGGQHFRILQFGRYNTTDSNYWRGQIAQSFYEDRMWFRKEYSTTWGSWQELWHTGNDGSGSGLDADLLDGLSSGSFMRSAGTENSGTIIIRDNRSTTNYYNSVGLEIRSADQKAIIGLHRDGYSHCGISHEASNQLRFNFNSGDAYINAGIATVWGSGNDGAGSGLDADLWDGYQFADYLNQAVKTNSSPSFSGLTVTGTIWTGYHGSNAYNGGSGASLYFGGDTGGAYRLWTQFENINGNYTKLNIDWHTGIRIGAYWNYGGIRFYDDAIGYGSANGHGNKVFSVAEGDTAVRAYYSMRAPIYYDSANTSFYVDPASTSRLNTITVGNSSRTISIGTQDEGAADYARIRTNGSGSLMMDSRDGQPLYLNWWQSSGASSSSFIRETLGPYA